MMNEDFGDSLDRKLTPEEEKASNNKFADFLHYKLKDHALALAFYEAAGNYENAACIARNYFRDEKLARKYEAKIVH